MNSVQNETDYKVLFEYIFPDKAAPRVKIPLGYKEILEGTLMDGREISNEQLENLRSNLMEQLRITTTPLSTNLHEETRGRLKEVVMVTAPGWTAKFKPLEDILEGFDVNKLPLPTKDKSTLQGPITLMIMLFAVMALSLVVRLLVSASGTQSQSTMIKQLLLKNPSYPNVEPGSLIFSKTSGSAESELYKSIVATELVPPQINHSYAIIPGFILFEITQIAVLGLYTVLLPFILLLGNTAQFFGKRSMELIESVESILFQTNKHYTSQTRFTSFQKDNFVKLLFKPIPNESIPNLDSLPLKLEEIVAVIHKKLSLDPSKKFKKILKSNEDVNMFVQNNLKRFLKMETDGVHAGKYKVSEDAIYASLDSFNLFTFDGENMIKFWTPPDFLQKLSESAFSYPILVKKQNNTFKIVPQYYWDTYDIEYLKMPPNFKDSQTPDFNLKHSFDPTNKKYSIEEVTVKFQEGSVEQLTFEDAKKLKEQISKAEKGKSIDLEQTSEPKTESPPEFLKVRVAEESNQMAFNLIGSYLRSFGLMSGFVGTTSAILLLLVVVMKVLDNFTGYYKGGYNYGIFEKMIFISSDAYYNWVKRSNINKSDVSKFNNYVTQSNHRVRIVDMSKQTTDKDKITKMIEMYNTDVSSTNFIRNQIFLYVAYIFFIITLPYAFLWFTAGPLGTPFVFEVLGPMGTVGEWGPYMAVPILLALTTITLFIIGIVYLLRGWFRTLDDDKKPDLWKTKTEVGDSNSPNKESLGSFSREKAKTLRYLTANGSPTNSLNQNNQDKRLVKAGSIFNPNAFYRTRVLFITNSDDLNGYYLRFIQPLKSVPATSPTSSSPRINVDSTDAGISITVILLSVIIISAFILGIPAIYGLMKGSSGGVRGAEANILKSGIAASKYIKQFMADFKLGSESNFYKMIIAWVAMAACNIWPIIELASYSPEVVTATKKKGKMQATELAYGSLPFISNDSISVNSS